MKRFSLMFTVLLSCLCFCCSSSQKTDTDAQVVFEDADFYSEQPTQAAAIDKPNDVTFDLDNKESEYEDDSFSEREDAGYYYYRVGSFRGEGDCLASIARKYYNDTNKWHKIYNANRDKISDPNVVRQGTLLKIPKE